MGEMAAGRERERSRERSIIVVEALSAYSALPLQNTQASLK